MKNNLEIDHHPTAQTSVPPGDSCIYQIEVFGQLAGDWSAWLNGLEIQYVEHNRLPVTRITAEIADQSALRGILTRLWDMNLAVLAVNRLNIDLRSDTDISEIFCNGG